MNRKSPASVLIARHAQMAVAWWVVPIVTALCAVPGRARAQTREPDRLGTVDFSVSCSAQVRPVFNRAIALLHHMTYPGARAAFQEVARHDPRCAMAHWGIAMTLFQPLWPTRPGPEALRQGWEEIRKAESTGPLTRRERLLVEAGAAFFRDPASLDYWQRIRRWEHAMETAYLAFPQDDEVASLYALAHLAVAPADTVSQTHSARAARILLAILSRNPAHPGAMHYLVHANDAPGREHESLDVVRRYEQLAPRNPHALHMPTHIYTRLGDWDASIRGNQRAAAAALEQPAGNRGQFVWDEFPHAIEYLVYAYLQQGADQLAEEQLERLLGTTQLQPTFKTAFHLASTQARYALERHAWQEAVTLVPRHPETLDWDRFPWPEAVIWVARGIGAAHLGNLPDARAARARLAALESTESATGESLFARNIRILRLEVDARLAHAAGNAHEAVARMREAAALEVSTPKHAVTPAPTLPASELLGDLLLELDRPADALTAYRESLERYPRRFNSLLGAARAARSSGEGDAARTYYQTLLDQAAPSGRPQAIAEARTFIASQ